MEKKEFQNFCKKEFEKQGFKKIKNTYYLVGLDLLCGILLQKSNFGNVYYINYFFCIGNFEGSNNYPTYHDSDIDGRVIVTSKTTSYGKFYKTAQIEYEYYTEDELRPFFEKEFEEVILPPVYQGKKYILENLNKLYYLKLYPEEVMRKLQS